MTPIESIAYTFRVSSIIVYAMATWPQMIASNIYNDIVIGM